MNPKRDYPALFQFFGAYFHEDFLLEAATAEEVISNYVRSRKGQPELHELSCGILDFIHDHPNDADLARALFEELGCYYSPGSLGLSPRKWLLDVAAKL
jgi:hypothetical protein